MPGGAAGGCSHRSPAAAGAPARTTGPARGRRRSPWRRVAAPATPRSAGADAAIPRARAAPWPAGRATSRTAARRRTAPAPRRRRRAARERSAGRTGATATRSAARPSPSPAETAPMLATSAAQSGLGEIAHRVAPDPVVIGGVDRVMDATQVRQGVRRASGAERGEAAGELRRREHGARADRQADLLGAGGQRSGGFLLAAQRRQQRLHRVGGRHDQRLPGLLGQPGCLRRGAGMPRPDRPAARRSRPAAPAPGRAGLPGPQARRREREEPGGQVEGPDRHRRSAGQPGCPRVGLDVRPQLVQAFHHRRAPSSGRGKRQDDEQPRVILCDLQPLGGRGHVVARRRAGIGPPAPQGRAVQQLEREIGVAVGAGPLGADRQRARLRGLAGMPSAKLSLIHATRACSRAVRSCGPASASKSWTRSCRPSSNPSSAARSSRPARRWPSPSAAARRSADTATTDAPRRWARSAVASSSSATASSGPMIAAARCQTARSGCRASARASAACAAWRCDTLACWRMAVRISGCRNRSCVPSISTSCAEMAGTSTSTASARAAGGDGAAPWPTRQAGSASSAAAASTSLSSGPSFNAATSSAVPRQGGQLQRPGRERLLQTRRQRQPSGIARRPRRRAARARSAVPPAPADFPPPPAGNARARRPAARGAGVKQRGRRRRGQRAQGQRRQPGLAQRGLIAVADGGDQQDRLELEPAGDERQRVAGGLVEPVGVVRDNQDRGPRPPPPPSGQARRARSGTGRGPPHRSCRTPPAPRPAAAPPARPPGRAGAAAGCAARRTEAPPPTALR